MALFIKVFISFLKIGVFAFGGGLAMVPLIQREIVEKNHWLSIKTLKDIVGISQMTPGPIAINSATFVGYKVDGILGSIFGTLGVITISFILVTIASHYFEKFKEAKILKAAFLGMRPAIVGLILSVVINFSKDAYVDIKSIIIALIIGSMLFSKKVHPIVAIISSGILAILLYGFI